jgi:acyl dehydratase
VLLLLPGGLDGGGADLADALDLAELAGLLAEDAEGVGAEGVDDLVGVDFADAGDEAAAEVFADAVDGGGELGLVRDDLELRAVLRVPRPFARQQEGLAALHAGQCADDGDAVLGGLGGLGAQLGDGVVVLLVEEDDALKDAGQGGGSGGGHGGPTDAHRCAGRQYRRNRLRGKSGHIGVMRYFDDLQAGDKFNTAEYEMTAEEIIAFGRKFDPQAFHTDPVAAKGTLFGQLVASGWHTAAVSMQLMVLGEMALDGGVIGQGMESLRWPRPVLPGDRLRVVTEIEELRPAPARPDRGLVKLRCRTYNQNDKVVQDMTATLLVARRPA